MRRLQQDVTTPAGWLLDALPAPLLRVGAGQLQYWQWLALPCLALLAFLLGKALSRLSRKLLTRFAHRTGTRWDDEFVELSNGPLSLAWTLVTAALLLPWLELNVRPQAYLERTVRVGFLLALFWALARGIEMTKRVLSGSTLSMEHPASRALLPLVTSVAKALVLVVGAMALLSEFGYQVATLLAGLGIGGLAVALAAQKTIENLFGAFTLGADQPFRVGDFVRIEDFVGTVENIGLRSTRIRTLDRTLISVPNGKLVEMRLESFSARDRLRLACNIGLVYSTSTEQMRKVLADFERALREHDKIWSESVVVRFAGFGPSSLDIEVMAWFETQDWGEFQLIRQEILLQFMAIVDAAGTTFAFPTRTLHLIKEANETQDSVRTPAP